MPYLVDTDWFIDYIAEERQAVELLEQLSADGIALSIVSYMESYQGVLRSSKSGRSAAALRDVPPGRPRTPLLHRGRPALRESP